MNYPSPISLLDFNMVKTQDDKEGLLLIEIPMEELVFGMDLRWDKPL
jgi:hypothetical protein